MNYGGIEFKHVWQFQIRIMMGNQYSRCINARTSKDIIVACLRLGWNDAFRHTSKNKDEIKNSEKENIIVGVCKDVADNFVEYATKNSTKERCKYIDDCLKNQSFKDKFARIKVVDDREDKALCFGHIQKMFNMAIKLFLCLKICVEQANSMGIELGIKKSLFNCNFAFDTADCPVDSIILSSLEGCDSIKWSKIGHTEAHPSKEYQTVQEAIKNALNDTTKSNLYYDFENWN